MKPLSPSEIETIRVAEPKHDPLSIDGVIAWLETKRPNSRYNFENCRGKCLYGQYMAHHGVSWVESGACGALVSTPERSDFCNVVYEKIAAQEPWTFGAALTRARAALDEQRAGR